MKITGIILILIGLAAGTICVVNLAQPTQPDRQMTPAGDDQLARPNMALPLALSGAAIVVGGLMVMYGGRGYAVSADPQVRN